MKIHFHKYSATGNDFVLIDDRSLTFPVNDAALIKKICARRTGIGADGLILLQPDQSSDFLMRHFNPDSSEAEMCGNGARSIIWFAKSLGMITEKTRFQTMLDCHEGIISGQTIKIKMNPIRNLNLKKKIDLPANMETGGYLEIGVPHFVVFVKDVAELAVNKTGAEISHHPIFSKGTNVNFVQLLSKDEIRIRTFERGVEEETLSCGTGATASAILASKLKGLKSPLKVNVLGGQLQIEFDVDFQKIWLSGPVEEVYQGMLNL